MALAEIQEIKDERTTKDRPAIEVYPSKSDQLSRAEKTLVRQGQRLDVDGILARSFRDVKSIDLR